MVIDVLIYSCESESGDFDKHGNTFHVCNICIWIIFICKNSFSYPIFKKQTTP